MDTHGNTERIRLSQIVDSAIRIFDSGDAVKAFKMLEEAGVDPTTVNRVLTDKSSRRGVQSKIPR
jgi:hypothetical protein